MAANPPPWSLVAGFALFWGSAAAAGACHIPTVKWHSGVVDLGSDDELLARQDGESFGVFYARHERLVLGWLRRRTGSADLAADLAAETFAQALVARGRYRPQAGGSAVAWLLGIAAHVLSRSVRRGRVEDQARRRLGVTRLSIDDEQLTAIDRLGTHDALIEALQELPATQRDALMARVVDEEPYAEIASRLDCSPALARQRVHRALSTLRTNLEKTP